MEINYTIALEIDTSTDGASSVWSDMGGWVKNATPALNEVLYQSTYYKDKGWGSTEVTGGQFTITLTGDCKPDDASYSYIFDKERQYAFGDKRKGKIRVRRGTEAIVWNVTFANITDGMGDANQPNAATVTIHGNGAPKFEKITE